MIVLGLLMLGVLFFVSDSLAWKLDLAIGLALLILGTVMFVASNLSEPQQENSP
jgi:hypothetical protein